MKRNITHFRWKFVLIDVHEIQANYSSLDDGFSDVLRTHEHA